MGGALIGSLGDYAFAQNITLDGSFGPAGTLTGPNYVIPEAVGQTVGSNLFHSFGRFSLDTGEAAIFISAANIKNILSRVTGGSPSLIDGSIATTSRSVNLFLINPSGILFGPNASLYVGSVTRGSFVATTVDALVWPNGGQFSATNPGDSGSLLTLVGDPSGFLSLQRPPQAIVSSGSSLRVYERQSLLLLGGDVTLDGSFVFVDYFEGGRIELGGVAGAGTVGLSVNGNDLRLNFPDSVARADVSVTNGARIDVLAEDGGTIAINARNLNISGGSELDAGIKEGLGSIGSQAGDIKLNATGAITVSDSSTIYNLVRPGEVGNGGNIDITAGSLSVTNGAKVAARTFGQGDAGSVMITVSGAVRFDGEGSDGTSSGAFSTVEPRAVGNGGNVNITAGSLSVTNGAGLSGSTRGQGNAGSVTINASEAVSFDGVDSSGFPSTAGSSVELGAVGNGGNVNITTRSISVTNGAQLGAGTFGQGNAGNVTITATDSVSFDGVSSNGVPSATASTVEQNAVGNGGNVNITARSLSVTNGAGLSSSTFGQGNAGNVTITASEAVSFDGVGSNGTPSSAGSQVQEGAVGNGGNVNITTRSLSVTNGAALSVTTDGQGDAGNVNIQTSESVSFDGDSSHATSSVYSSAVGKGGNVNITTGLLSVTNGAQLTASTDGQGDAGNINITTRSLSVTNDAQLSVSTFGQRNAGSLSIQASDTVSFDNSIAASASDTGAEGNGGDINITARSLSVTNGAQLIANTRGKGNAGNVIITASEAVSFDGVDRSGFPSAAASTVEEGAEGKGGSINITTRSLTIQNDAGLTAGTSGKGDAGDINIATRQLNVRNGGRIVVSTSGAGRGGTLEVIASDLVELDGATPDAQSGTGLFAGTLATGDAGNLKIATGQLIVRDGAKVTVSGTSSGNAGDIEITARAIELDNQGKLIAETTSGQGGEIILSVQDLLLLRQGSSISTNAGTEKAGGDGGNINIDTKFIVAVPSENSDITANAYTGKGGRVEITTQGIFGTQFREQLTPESDITASSQFGVNGTVQLNTPDIDPSRGLANLPIEVVDASNQIDQTCAAGRGEAGKNEFIIIGRGGLPSNPYEMLSSDEALEDVYPPSGFSSRRESKPDAARIVTPQPRTGNPKQQLVEAQGWGLMTKVRSFSLQLPPPLPLKILGFGQLLALLARVRALA
jgi:filamentous hemagglutinin family protein